MVSRTCPRGVTADTFEGVVCYTKGTIPGTPAPREWLVA
ncbi:hypothetical protein YT1_0566 [Rhodococcus ruber]|nr:hypothetical protein YT1_0566 [Rhodococcus ruber]